MGVTKTSLYSEKELELAQLAKGFSHPARIAIIQYLIKANACINGDLVKEIGLSQATISQHLRELKEIGIIQGTIEGVSVSYCINPSKWNEMKSLFEDLFNMGPDKTDCC